MKKDPMSHHAPTRGEIPNPEIAVDIRGLANEINGGKATRPSRRKAISRGEKARRSGRFGPSAEDLAMYAEYIGGKGIVEVSQKYGIATSTVHRVIRSIDAWLIPQMMDDIKSIKCQHTQRLLHVVCESMAGWERSKTAKTKNKFERDEDGKLFLSEVTKEPQAGNPAFLATAMKALEDIRMIWGADAPVAIHHSGELRVSGISIEEARGQFAAKLEAAAAAVRQRLTLAAPSGN